MPYTATTFNSGAAPGIDAPTLNVMQTQFSEAVQSIEQDMFTPWVLSGFTAVKDGTTATQLDVAAGVAFPLQTDSTLRRRSAGALTYSTVGHASASMFLDYNPDGTWSWGTAHSAVANHLTICTVTTDASANIATVTDTRVVNTTLFSGAVGTVSQNAGRINADGGAITSNGSGTISAVGLTASGTVSAATLSASGNATISGGVITGKLGASITIGNGTSDVVLTPPAGHWTYLNSSATNNTYVDSAGAIHDGGTLTVVGSSSLDNGAITTNGSGTITGALNGTASNATNLANVASASDDGTNTRLKPTNNSRVTMLQASGAGGPVDVLSVSPTVVQLVAGSTNAYYFKGNLHGSVGDWILMGQVRITGTGAGTVSHTLGVTPTTCMLNTHVASGTQTMGYDSETSTTVHIDSGGSMAWIGSLHSMG